MICVERLTASGMKGTFWYSAEQGRSADLSESAAEFNGTGDVFDNAEDEEFPFELLASPHSPSKERPKNSLLPLVPGFYWLCGRDQTNWLVVTDTKA